MIPALRPLPRTLVTASAGSGKTYRLSTEILDLLARGAPPGSILASTFTRKAAGEILERVLLRLAEAALDPAKAHTLGQDAQNEVLSDPVRCQAILHRLLGQMHQLNVSTLDSFFVRVVRSFFHTLGLPPTWNLADPVIEAQLVDDTLGHMMRALDASGGTGTLSRFFRGEHRRDIHAQLKDGVEELLQFARLAERTDAWGDREDFWELTLATPVLTLEQEALDARIEALVASIATLELPVTRKGTPDSRWLAAQRMMMERLATRQWGDLLSKGIPAALEKDPGAPTYYGTAVDSPWIEVVAAAQDLGRAALAPGLAHRLRAAGDLAAELHASYRETQARMGVLRFEDVTLRLGDPSLSMDASEIHYRLDQQIQHVLLDEFQDTSEIQWAALEPLVGELLSGDEGLRAAVLVADPKQSIYGWRKARPELVHQVGAAYALTRESLQTSWRSSPVILDRVHEIFSEIPSNPVMMSLPDGAEVAAGWVKDFTAMKAAKTTLPGYVCAHRVPPTTGSARGVEPAVLRAAARTLKAIHEEAPSRSMGVLLRQNRAVAQIITELKALGVPVSGEGGAPLTDTAPVLALLSLLRLADHPADRIARYHVIKTPARVLVPELTAVDDGAAARRVAAEIRRALLAEGYGATMASWVAALIPDTDAREAARLGQLVELAHRWDEKSTLRPVDFVHHVMRTVVEDPSRAPVRVMTIHKSKGLEFDIVALPDLYQSLNPRSRARLIPAWGETGRIEGVFPAITTELEPYFPEIASARVRAQQPDVRDSLSLLYVALTRPRQALHLFIPENGGGSKSAARLLAAALDITVAADTAAADTVTGETGEGAGGALDSGILKCWGEPRWFEAGAEADSPPTTTPPPEAQARATAEADSEPERAAGQVALDDEHGPLLRPASPETRRNLPRRSPSDAKGGEAVDLALRLHLGGAPARDRGTLVHAWCEVIDWLEDGLPNDDLLRTLARRHAPAMGQEDVEALVATFRIWMTAPEIGAAMSRGRYHSAHPGAALQVEAEYPFIHITDGVLQEGFIDRLVLVREGGAEGGRVVAAEVLDFKTDRVVGKTPAATAEALADRTERYRAQIAAYCALVRERFGLSPRQVRGTLLFLEAGRDVAVDLDQTTGLEAGTADTARPAAGES
jgi:ATP-dependent helicase/nuclease subunit A